MTRRPLLHLALGLAAFLAASSGRPSHAADPIGTSQIIDGETRAQREVARAKAVLQAMLGRAAATDPAKLAARTHCGSYPSRACARFQSHPMARRHFVAEIAVAAAAKALGVLPTLRFALSERKLPGTDAHGEKTLLVARKSPAAALQVDLWRSLAESSAVDEAGHHELLAAMGHELGHFLSFETIEETVTDFGRIAKLEMTGGDFLDYLMFLWSQNDAGWEPHLTSMTADVDGDGRTDYLTYNLAFLDALGFTAHLSRGTGAFRAGTSVREGLDADAGNQLAVGDFDGDGRTDCLVYRLDHSGSHESRLYLSDGTGGFRPAPPFRDGWSYPRGFQLVTGDFNGDRRADYLIYSLDHDGRQESHVYLRRPAGGFGPRKTFRAEHRYGADFQLVTGDFNGDGSTDTLIYSLTHDGEQESHVYLSDGAGGFQPRKSSKGGYLFPKGFRLVTGDFNGDGRTDTMIYHLDFNYHQESSVYLSDETGGFPPRTLFKSGPVYPAGFQLVTGDFNGDGRTDYMVHSASHAGSQEANVHLSDGTGSFHARATFRDGNGYATGFQLATGDFNGDRRTDYLLHDPRYRDSHENNVYVSRPGGGFSRLDPF